jgi:hypothetical protein
VRAFAICWAPARGLAYTIVACIALSGCTIDPGPDTMPPVGCAAPPDFFVTDVWPKYFAQYACGRSDCHDASSGHGFFRLQPLDGVTPPSANAPLSTWPPAWQSNFQAVLENLSCADPVNSLVLAVPSGRGQPHPPGTVVTDIPGADQLFRMWLGQ